MGRVVHVDGDMRVFPDADTAVRLLRVVRQSDAQGNLINEQIFDGTEFDVRSFFSTSRGHQELNKRMDRAVQKLLERHAGQPPTVRSHFGSIGEVDTSDDRRARWFGHNPIHYVPLYFAAASSLRQHLPNNDTLPDWSVYICTDKTRRSAEDDVVLMMGVQKGSFSTNRDLSPWGVLNLTLGQGMREFKEHYNTGAPLKNAWHAGSLAIDAAMRKAEPHINEDGNLVYLDDEWIQAVQQIQAAWRPAGGHSPID